MLSVNPWQNDPARVTNWSFMKVTIMNDRLINSTKEQQEQQQNERKRHEK